MSELTREQISFSFDGPGVDSHEVEVSLLAESLLAFRSLSEKATKAQHGRGVDPIVKVKGGFRAGSFIVDIVIDVVDWATKNPDAATTIGGATVGGVVAGAIKIYKWAKGKPVEVTHSENGITHIKNRDGQISVFNNCSVAVYNTSSTKSDVEKLTRPLDRAGITSLSIQGEGEDSTVSIDKDEREFFRQEEVGVIRDTEDILTLEIVNASLRGEPTGWRFYDGSVEFTAPLEDEEFLSTVKTGGRTFKSGDMVEVRMRAIQRRPAQRLITDRTVLQVLSFIPSES